MDHEKVGRLILQLRRERDLTQRELAQRLHVSPKTVSKWECGRGAPDVSVWEALSRELGADGMKLLRGELRANRKDPGKMERVRFYVCPTCGNLLTSTGKAGVTCCGRRLSPLAVNQGTEGHDITVEEMDLDYYVAVGHEMTKAHYLSFAACVWDDRVWLQRLYPEQSPDFRVPATRGGGTLYLHCVQHGLFRYPNAL